MTLPTFLWKKGFRPALCFIEERREYFAGKLRVGETMGWKRACRFVAMRIPEDKPSEEKTVQLKAVVHSGQDYLAFEYL